VRLNGTCRVSHHDLSLDRPASSAGRPVKGQVPLRFAGHRH